MYPKVHMIFDLLYYDKTLVYYLLFCVWDSSRGLILNAERKWHSSPVGMFLLWLLFACLIDLMEPPI